MDIAATKGQVRYIARNQIFGFYRNRVQAILPIRVSTITGFTDDAFEYSKGAPGLVIMDGRDDPGRPHNCQDRKIVIRTQKDFVACVGIRRAHFLFRRQ